MVRGCPGNFSYSAPHFFNSQSLTTMLYWQAYIKYHQGRLWWNWFVVGNAMLVACCIFWKCKANGIVYDIYWKNDLEWHRLILTARNCGSKTWKWLGMTCVHYCWQELRVQNSFIHPRWAGNIKNGYDAALLRLSRAVKISTPRLADQSFDLYPNSEILVFHLGPNLEVAKFDVVANWLCPHLNTLSNGTFCAYSDFASMRAGVVPWNRLVLSEMEIVPFITNAHLLIIGLRGLVGLRDGRYIMLPCNVCSCICSL